jgi:Sortase domain
MGKSPTRSPKSTKLYIGNNSTFLRRVFCFIREILIGHKNCIWVGKIVEKLENRGISALLLTVTVFFRALKDIRAGDRIKLAAPSGDFLYAVDEIEIVDPSNVSVLKNRPRPSLTVVTCYPFYYVGMHPSVTSSTQR